MAATGTIPEGWSSITEGKATVLSKGDNSVFYNPAQVANRDVSIAVLKWFIQQREQELASGKGVSKRAQKRAKAAGNGAAPSGNGAGPSDGPSTAPAPPVDPEAPPAAVEGEAQATPPQGIRVLEGMAASGLRSIRYALEVPGIAHIDTNDLDVDAVEAIKRNVAFNGGRAAEIIRPMKGDARMAMYTGVSRDMGRAEAMGYDMVDLDPYGSPAQLLDAAVQSVCDGGLLAVTATDMAVLCGNNGEVCWTKYGSYPIHRTYCHEQALRILLASIESHANRYKRHIKPVLSLSIDFYIRVFVRVYTSPAEIKKSASKLAYLFQSQGCDSFYLQPVGEAVDKGKSFKYTAGHGPAVPQECPETGARFLMGGPIWADPIHSRDAVAGIRAILERDRAAVPCYTKVYGLVTSALDELPDAPLYVDMHSVCATVRCPPPKTETMKSALINAGYRVSDTHACPTAIKTDAPWPVVWDVIRCWIKDHPGKVHPPDSYPARLLAKEPKLEANWARAQGAVSSTRMGGVTRFATNPANWGPKSAAGKEKRTTVGHLAQMVKRKEAEGKGEAGPGEEGAEAAKKAKHEDSQVPAP